MSATFTRLIEPPTELDAEATAHLLSAAVSQHAPVGLRAVVGGMARTWAAELVGENDDRLTLQLKNIDAARGAVPAGVDIQIRFSVDDVRYVFETRRDERRTDDEPLALCVRKPSTIAQSDRRKAARRHLHRGADVMVHPFDLDGATPISATLLNASPNGLACRLTRPAADVLTIGQTVRVSFRPAGASSVINLQADVANLTCGDDGTYLVAGLEFTASDEFAAGRSELEKVLGLGNLGLH